MGRIPSASFLVHRLETSGFIAKKPLYIATEPARPDGYFKPFEKKWKVSYSTSFRPLIRYVFCSIVSEVHHRPGKDLL